MVRVGIRKLSGLSLPLTAVTTNDTRHIYYFNLLYKCVGVNRIVDIKDVF